MPSNNIDTELLSDFLAESFEIISDVENKLVDLEKNPQNSELLNAVFRGFHTIKGGAGFLGAKGLVNICHKTESLFDHLRSGRLKIDSKIMDAILDASAAIRSMFNEMSSPNMRFSGVEEHQSLNDRLDLLISMDSNENSNNNKTKNTEKIASGLDLIYEMACSAYSEELEANKLPELNQADYQSSDEAKTDQSVLGIHRFSESAQKQETSIRVDAARLDDVLTLSGEIGLTKNRLTTLRSEIISGRATAKTLQAFDHAVSQIDLLVSSLQSAVMKTRMQPISRLFQKYPRVIRDLSRDLGKEVDLLVQGGETELDKTMVDELGDPLLHLVRNALDHGIESPEDRILAGKSSSGTVSLSAFQVGDHICIEVIDDGKGIKPELIRRKAIEKGLISQDYANGLDDRQSLGLIFLPGFSTAESVSNISGRGVGMDVVKNSIQKLNGQIEIQSSPGEGSSFLISLPLTMAILSVLIVKVNGQCFAIPLSTVREILPIVPSEVQELGGKKVLVIRDEILRIKSLTSMLNMYESGGGRYGVVVKWGSQSFILSVDEFVGRDDVVIKPLLDVKPIGIAGATLSGDGEIVMIIDFKELLGSGADVNYL